MGHAHVPDSSVSQPGFQTIGPDGFKEEQQNQMRQINRVYQQLLVVSGTCYREISSLLLEATSDLYLDNHRPFLPTTSAFENSL